MSYQGSNRSVHVQGDACGTAILTGDRNVVQQGKYDILIGCTSELNIGDEAQAEQPDDECSR